ncbi:hypothetical protein Prudu_015343 [Prunus dulcis]|uniref:Uncharacterized protein n=1 Tax=Prunus dulcis TaxID=3755 RepID=A0A4Y1RIW5_PRUDU|nr:hypothetical protein Prudu_015343 [Prunus dulcis]
MKICVFIVHDFLAFVFFIAMIFLLSSEVLTFRLTWVLSGRGLNLTEYLSLRKPVGQPPSKPPDAPHATQTLRTGPSSTGQLPPSTPAVRRPCCCLEPPETAGKRSSFGRFSNLSFSLIRPPNQSCTRGPVDCRRDLRRVQLARPSNHHVPTLYLVITQSWTDVYGHPVRFQFTSVHLTLPHEFRDARTRMERTETIDNFKVGSLPTLIYIPDFITDNEQTMLLNKAVLSMKRVFYHRIYFKSYWCGH